MYSEIINAIISLIQEDSNFSDIKKYYTDPRQANVALFPCVFVFITENTREHMNIGNDRKYKNDIIATIEIYTKSIKEDTLSKLYTYAEALTTLFNENETIKETCNWSLLRSLGFDNLIMKQTIISYLKTEIEIVKYT